MREIKFRAWDDKEMYYNPYIPNHGTWAMIDESIKDCQDNYKSFMQSTGLKDKNGKDIYEGDIISFPSGTSTRIEIEHDGQKMAAYKENPNKIGLVLYHNAGFQVHNSNEIKGITGVGYYGCLGTTRHLKYTFEIEIIGNIHEDKHLLDA